MPLCGRSSLTEIRSCKPISNTLVVNSQPDRGSGAQHYESYHCLLRLLSGAATGAKVPLARGAQARAITPQSPVRIRNKQLEPRSSERSRPRGFVLRWGRDAATCPVDSHGFATLELCWASLSRRRARPAPFIRTPLRRPVSGTNSRPSLRLALPGLRGVGFALSVATYRGWLRRVGREKNETWTTKPDCNLASNQNGFFGKSLN